MRRSAFFLSSVLALSLLMSFAASFVSAVPMVNSMLGFMLLILGGLKLANFSGFCTSIVQYDKLADRYSFIPFFWVFIEIVGGFLVLLGFVFPAVIVFVYALLSAWQVYNYVRSDAPDVSCGCSGAFFGLKVSYVTFVEFILIAIFALIVVLRF